MAADDLVHDPSRNTAEDDDPLRRVRLEKLAALRDMGIEPYPVTFSRDAEAADLEKRHADLPAGAETQERVRVAGRMRDAQQRHVHRPARCLGQDSNLLPQGLPSP